MLVDNCYKCHSADAQKAGKLKGELLLDTRDGLLKGGENGPALVPGKPDESRLIKAVRYTRRRPEDAAEGAALGRGGRGPGEMGRDGRARPARVAGRRRRRAGGSQAASSTCRPRATTGRFGRWPRRSRRTSRGSRGELGTRTPIDRFILAAQEQKGVTPNGPAARRVLIRRAYFDLIGLPPTPEEVDAFVNDPSRDAWEKLIDRLLASDRYGERWGRHWLDVVRFAESNGYEFDADRPGAYQYRDFVIRAINRDMPYDQFVRWQVAGDKLAPDEFDAARRHRLPGRRALAGADHRQDRRAAALRPARRHDLDPRQLDARPDGRLLPLPRPQVRPAPAAGLLPARRVLRRHRRGRAEARPPRRAVSRRPRQVEGRARCRSWRRGRSSSAKSCRPASRSGRRTARRPTCRPSGWCWTRTRPRRSPARRRKARRSWTTARCRWRTVARAKQTFTFVVRTRLKEITGLKVEALADKSLPKPGPGRRQPRRVPPHPHRSCTPPRSRAARASRSTSSLSAVKATSRGQGQGTGPRRRTPTRATAGPPPTTRTRRGRRLPLRPAQSASTAAPN